LKTKEQELVALLDIVFDSAAEPDWAFVQENCYLSRYYSTWLLRELLRLMWLCNEDQAAFDEEIWRLTNEAQ
jgi:hypothetical protein